jgi:N-methylhydantoinase A
VVVAAPAPTLPSRRLTQAKAPPPEQDAPVVVEGKRLRAARIRRRDLAAGHRLSGPAIVQEYSATTWVPPGWALEVDGWGNLSLAVDL